MTHELAVGDVVRISAEGHKGDHGEIETILPGAIGVRIVQEESSWRGQIVYFNAGQLELVMGRKEE